MFDDEDRRMPSRAYDEIGEYHYTPGWCARDAFARGLGGAHPLVDEIPYLADLVDIGRLCRKYGLEHQLSGKWHRDFQAGEAVVWIITPESGVDEGHAVFCRDPSRVTRARALGQCVICGYVLLDDSQHDDLEQLLAGYRTPLQRRREGCLAAILAGLLWALCALLEGVKNG